MPSVDHRCTEQRAVPRVRTIAEAIREAQGRSSSAMRDLKRQDLIVERKKSAVYCQEIEELQTKLASLASINDVLINENCVLKARMNDSK
ncbi:hypothetical protein ACXITL_24265, partial [Escherichia coli]